MKMSICELICLSSTLIRIFTYRIDSIDFQFPQMKRIYIMLHKYINTMCK